jgi:deazaflavin-dependent oxidoreductase (nitroreductase family)
MTANEAQRYVKPNWFTKTIMNPAVGWLTARGFSGAGSRVLAVKGRKSGEWRTTPVNLLSHEGRQYLVAPRGATQWVRNIRVSGKGELRVGRHSEPISVVEVPDAEKVPVLRSYLKRWGWEVSAFFEGLKGDASDEQLREIAPGFPVFRIR